MITESDFKHEYLFVLGNGASIASAYPELRRILKCVPTIGNFIPLVKEIKKISERNKEPTYFELSALMDEYHLDILLRNSTQRVIEISAKKGTEDIVRLLVSLMDEENCIGEKIDMSRGEEHNLPLISKLMSIYKDINVLTSTIFGMVGAYYDKFDNKYFSKLWQLVQKTKAPLVSLNWDVNFERTVFESTNVDMKNYYGECAFGHLFSHQQETPYNPVVDILKPHGSLNWHFVDLLGLQGRLGGNLLEKDYHFVISNNVASGPSVDYDLRHLSFLIPPLPEKEIPLINESIQHCSLDPFWKRKKAIKDDIFTRIKEYAASTCTLVIIGYSFPGDDEHIKELFVDNRFEEVWVFDTSEKTCSDIDKERCFQNATRRFFKDGFAHIMNWPDVGEGFKPSRLE